MFGSSLRARPLAAVLIAGTIALGSAGLSTGTANAIGLGPNLRGYTSGSVDCDLAHHTVTLYYTALPENFVNFDTGSAQVAGYAEWVEVYAYIKVAGSSSWGAPLAHITGLASGVGTTTILAERRSEPAGRYYDVGYWVRVAYPGGTYSDWSWELATMRDSLSGTNFSPNSWCRT